MVERFEASIERFFYILFKRLWTAIVRVGVWVGAIDRLFYILCKCIWNVFVWVGAIWLQIIWIIFLFGSVLGVILILIFAPGLFLLPLGLLSFSVKLSPEPGDE